MSVQIVKAIPFHVLTHSQIDTTTCKATAMARVPVVATGRVWFFYGETRKDKVTGEPEAHYHCEFQPGQAPT